jgi:DNA-binding beta-propeller fold protein YncE
MIDDGGAFPKYTPPPVERRPEMTRWVIAFLLLAWPAVAQQQQQQQDVPQIAFDSPANVLQLPKDLYLGEVAGVAVNSKGHIFVFHRGNSTGPAYAAAAAQLLEFDPNGKFLREIGHNLYAWSFAHTVRIDPQDNIWVADKGSDMIVKFDPQGRVALVLGRKLEASDEDTAPLKHPKPPLPAEDGRFRQVTDMTWDPQGNIFISDGYVNSRVAKVDKAGNWVKSWGDRGDKPGEFNTPHSIAADAKGNIYVADRFNRRIQVFDPQGTFVRAFSIDVPFDHSTKPVIGKADPNATSGTFSPGAPWAICITPGPNQVLYASDAYPGRIYKMTLDGQVLGTIGGPGRQLKQFAWIHEIACPSENVLYVAELLTWRVQKLILHGGRSTASAGQPRKQ